MRLTVLLFVVVTALVVAGGVALADVINGNDRDNLLQGTCGDDTMRGFGGDDVMTGARPTAPCTSGSDTMYGGDGRDAIGGYGDGDWIYGQNDDDTVSGGRGEDRAAGGPDVVFSDYGDDYVGVEDGVQANDIVTCGAGVDTVDADVNDYVDESTCESVTYH